MTREMCYRCFWPKDLCWCGVIRPMATRTRFVFLMHPMEQKRVKLGTGRLTHLCLENSDLRVGIGFDGDAVVRGLIEDPGNHAVLLYPERSARNVSEGELGPRELQGRRLVVFLLDATWSLARKMLRKSPTLAALPRIALSPSSPSRFVIKRQPQAGCLSTLEATHELLTALATSGLDDYPLPEQLLDLFEKMQAYQLKCIADPHRDGYRRRAGHIPAERSPVIRRRKFF